MICSSYTKYVCVCVSVKIKIGLQTRLSSVAKKLFQMERQFSLQYLYINILL